MIVKKTAGELANQALKDNTNYNVLEVGHALSDDIPSLVMESVQRHINIIDEDEFCVVMVLASDPLISTLIRRKFYCWPYLPKPRPNQTVWHYSKSRNVINRLWVLPTAEKMAMLMTDPFVPKDYKTMQAWSIAFDKGHFWEYIRWESGVKMPSEHEYFLTHRQELIDAGCQLPGPDDADAFDFSKIPLKKVVHPENACVA